MTLKLEFKGLNGNPFIARLAHILQIRRPIRMNLVAFLSEPLSWSFGPLPRSSSEGFLVTFTPWCVWEESIFFSGYLTEYGGDGSFHFDFMERAGNHWGFTYNLDSTWFDPFTKKDETGRNLLGLLAYPGFPDPRSKSSDRTMRTYLGGALEGDLMIPRLYTRGILVSLKPTDEGCLGMHPKYLKTVKFSISCYRRSLFFERLFFGFCAVPKA
jgi:hypothetical protein